MPTTKAGCVYSLHQRSTPIPPTAVCGPPPNRLDDMPWTLAEKISDFESPVLCPSVRDNRWSRSSAPSRVVGKITQNTTVTVVPRDMTVTHEAEPGTAVKLEDGLQTSQGESVVVWLAETQSPSPMQITTNCIIHWSARRCHWLYPHRYPKPPPSLPA